MEESKVLTLEIEWDWWIWHGFHPFSRIEQDFIGSPELEYSLFNLQTLQNPTDKGDLWVLRDPMDEDDYVEERGFPLLKPSIDVFGIPRRTRKQRGWYQVQRPSGRTLSDGVTVQAALPASAADLPPELISMFVDGLNPHDQRHTLALCAIASVRHRWADILQSKLFRKIDLYSSADVLQLRAFSETPLGKLSGYEQDLEAHQALVNAPILHLLPLMKSSAYSSVKAILRGPLATRKATLRSIVPHVPRSLPRSHFATVHDLCLGDIRFRTFVDLMRLVYELPALQNFSGDGLIWPAEPRMPSQPTWRRRITHVPNVTLSHCTPGQRWLALWLIERRCPAEEHRLFSGLAQQVEETLRDAEVFEAKFQMSFPEISWSRPDKSVEFSLKFLGRGFGIKATVDTVVLRMRERWFAATDWAVFAQTLGSCPNMKYIRIWLKQPSDQATAYMQYAHQHLQSLEYGCGIRLFIQEPL